MNPASNELAPTPTVEQNLKTLEDLFPALRKAFEDCEQRLAAAVQRRDELVAELGGTIHVARSTIADLRAELQEVKAKHQKEREDVLAIMQASAEALQVSIARHAAEQT